VTEAYDLVVIGGGPAGYVGAIRASQLGLRTALVERDKLGGACVHVGCIPTKSLLHTAELLQEMRNAAEVGILAEGVRLDYPRAQARKDKVVSINHRGVEYLLRKHGITVVPGQARVLAPNRVQVTAPGGATMDLETRHILLATGSEPRSLPGVAIDNVRILDSTGALRLPAVPGSVAILGAGAVGTEFASIFAAFGSTVTLVEMMPSILPLEDEEVAGVLAKSLQRRGVTVRTGTSVAAVTPHGEASVRVTVQSGGTEEAIDADCVLVAVGRAPTTEGLGLEEIGIQVGRSGIVVNDRMQTSVPSIYAAGDVIGGLLLAHVAYAEATVAVETIAGQAPAPLAPHLMPRATYSIPQVASVGLTEQQAREEGYEVSIGRFSFMANGRAAIIGQREGLVKIVCDSGPGEILGVHLVGPQVTELLPEGVLAKSLEATVLELSQAVHAHPTLSEAMREAALAALGRALHG
jgi:dihydrolipoamide dehydrogenase